MLCPSFASSRASPFGVGGWYCCCGTARACWYGVRSGTAACRSCGTSWACWYCSGSGAAACRSCGTSVGTARACWYCSGSGTAVCRRRSRLCSLGAVAEGAGPYAMSVPEIADHALAQYRTSHSIRYVSTAHRNRQDRTPEQPLHHLSWRRQGKKYGGKIPVGAGLFLDLEGERAGAGAEGAGRDSGE
eukprot:1501166-Rhodomonas_salina.1